ncbi:MAG: hypothetical protein Q3997_00395 [Propionibacteriaceae bacterium]|nr:hypothetical protein [Propionibacteriaceae bacterium]
MSTINISTWHRLLIAAAVLLFAAQFVTALIPTDFEVLGAVTWVEQYRVFLQVSNELRLFAALTLAAALVTWHGSAPTSARRAIGFSALGLAVVVELLMVIAEGRLAYPIPGLDLDDTTAALMIAMSYGASHAANILFAVAALALMLDPRAATGAWFSVASILVAGVQIVASFPWMLSAGLRVVAAFALLGWFALIASASRRVATGPSQRRDTRPT